jgi:hypothetical protein
MPKRQCGTCTKCCEGYLSGEALGHTFFAGKPCHFVAIGKGCSVYVKRPANPCVSYKCGWLTNEDIPEWMKPSDIDAIIDMREIGGISYLSLKETGCRLDSRVLSWFIQYGLNHGLCIAWEVDKGLNWIGTPEFNSLMTGLQSTFDLIHPK